jgi:hypothetical protein
MRSSIPFSYSECDLQLIFFLGFLIEDLQPPVMAGQHFIAIYRRIFPIHKSQG